MIFFLFEKKKEGRERERSVCQSNYNIITKLFIYLTNFLGYNVLEEKKQ